MRWAWTAIGFVTFNRSMMAVKESGKPLPDFVGLPCFAAFPARQPLAEMPARHQVPKNSSASEPHFPPRPGSDRAGLRKPRSGKPFTR